MIPFMIMSIARRAKVEEPEIEDVKALHEELGPLPKEWVSPLDLLIVVIVMSLVIGCIFVAVTMPPVDHIW